MYFSKMTKAFKFKQFEINQGRSAMKIGTDAVLLGAWADIETAESILDIGTGTGILALMAAQRNSKARICGIEYDDEAYLDALENVGISKWSDRIDILSCDIRKYQPKNKFDAILSNPPFFSAGKTSPDIRRSKARHTTTLTSKQLLHSVSYLLSEKGQFHCILAMSEYNQFLKYVEEHNLYIIKEVLVRPHLKKPVHRILLSMSFKNSLIQRKSMVLHNEGEREYSEGYVCLTKDFYLYM